MAERKSQVERTGIESPSETDLDQSPAEYDVTEFLDQDSEFDPVISVVMPTLNEEEGIVECIERVRNAVAELELPTEIIISDSSTDRTPELAREHGAIVVEPDKPGYGYAYRYALERARGEYIVIGDADTTYDFEELPKLFEHVAYGQADMAMGSRLDGEIKDGAMPALHQYVGNPLLTKFLNVFYDADVSDAHSGFRVFSQEALADLDLKTDGMEFASEMIMEAGARDLTIAEEPIVYHEREGEATLESFRDGWRHVRFMLLNAPGYLFSIPGFLLGFAGLVIMGLGAADVTISGRTIGPHSMIAGSLLTLVGAQAATLGAFSTKASDPIRRPSDPLTEWVLETVRLEHGATMGILLFGAGAAYGTLMLSRWFGTGFQALPLLSWDVIAMTAMVLGMQIVFNSFFLSVVNSD